MPHERVTSNRVRRAQKVRSEVIVKADTASITGDLLRKDDLPEHLQPVKEHYEEVIIATEVQNRTRAKAQATIVEMTVVTQEAALTINDKLVDSINYVNEEPMRPKQRDDITEVLDEITHIGNSALMDGLEESTVIVNDITDTNPTHRQRAKRRVRIDLTTQERLRGKVEREI